jgi:DNA invertase Pin-like site-specific DNA recombinase
MKGWRIDDGAFFVDAGVSGSVPLVKRPKGHRLLATAKKSDVIISARFSCVFRSAAYALSTLKELRKQRVAIHIIDLGGDACGDNIWKLVFTLLSAVAEHKNGRISESVRNTKRHLASRGVYSGGNRPFGFNLVGNILVADANEQAAISLMKAMRASDKSYNQIAAAIQTEFKISLLPMSIKRIIDRIDSSEA